MMEVEQLTDEQIANLTREQIEMLENDPHQLVEILGVTNLSGETRRKKPEREEDGSEPDNTSSPTDELDPVVLNKSGKGVIPYEKHKQLRVENSALREQLETAQTSLEELLKQKDEAKGADIAVADDAITKHLEALKRDMPELHQVISAVLEGSRKQGEKLEKTLEEFKREKEESERASESSVAEQVAEAKDNNPDLVHWEINDPEAWDEALKQDEILRTNSKWINKPYAERFDEVVRRVRAVMPEASAPKKAADPEKLKADAKAKLDAAPVRKPTTLSDIQGGANPASERERLENLSPFELTQKLMKMPPHQSAALRAELE
ncbi:hypothetical protein [Nitrosospira sp. Nsp2]|uniref:hypothetical protein n=1 Tax=Nitrosospira sp. Nsp2 TaxID=136548 RepID=UPI002158DC23|nr:hypothetical protein [Nitrosospira sp. Nsp2]